MNTGERSGKLLAYLAHLDSKPQIIVLLKGPDASNLTDPSHVAAQFKTFYHTLYTSQTMHSQQETKAFLQSIAFPHLNGDDIKMLEAPISIKDVTMTISQLAKSKAPGSDGLPLEFYATYSDLLIPKLQTLYQFILDTGVLPPSM